MGWERRHETEHHRELGGRAQPAGQVNGAGRTLGERVGYTESLHPRATAVRQRLGRVSLLGLSLGS
jgi:hypothetical protein